MLIGRRRELENLRELIRKAPQASLHVVYGPRGVGVTTLLKALVEELTTQPDHQVLYVDAAAATEAPLEALAGTPRLAAHVLASTPQHGDMPLGPRLALYLPVTLAKAAPLALRKTLIIVVDHVDRGLGIGRLRDYLDSLEATAKKLTHLAEKAAIIATLTPLAASKTNRPKHVLWGLDEKDYTTLIKNLRLAIDPHHAYTLTAGNPREAVNIATRYRGSLETWLKALKARTRKVRKLLEARGLKSTIPERPEEVDAMDPETLETLQAYDITINIADAKDLTPVKRPDPGKAIGIKWAWQLPAYHRILKETQP